MRINLNVFTETIIKMIVFYIYEVDEITHSYFPLPNSNRTKPESKILFLFLTTREKFIGNSTRFLLLLYHAILNIKHNALINGFS